MSEELKEKYIGFVDLLGYKHLVLGNFPKNKIKHYLQSIFENLVSVALEIKRDGPPNFGPNSIGENVDFISFSDCFFFQSDCPLSIVSFVSDFYSRCFTLYQNTYESHDEWQPFIRGGIVKDWVINVRDPSVLQTNDDREVFRNPIGPGTAKAYLLSEKEDISGMLLVVSDQVRDDFNNALARQNDPNGLLTSLTPLFLKNGKCTSNIYEIPWFEQNLMSDNLGSCLEILNQCREKQFTTESMKHWHGTMRTICRSPSVQGNKIVSAKIQEILGQQ